LDSASNRDSLIPIATARPGSQSRRALVYPLDPREAARGLLTLASSTRVAPLMLA